MCLGPRHGGPTTSAVSGGEREGEEGPQLDDLWPRAGNHEPRLTAAMDEAGGPLSSLSLTWFMSVLEHFLGAPSSAQLLTCVCFLFIRCVPLQSSVYECIQSSIQWSANWEGFSMWTYVFFDALFISQSSPFLSFTCRLNMHLRVEYKFFSLVIFFYNKPSVEIVIDENKKNHSTFFATALSNPLIW